MRNVSTSERLRIGAPAFAWLRTGVRWTTGGAVLFAVFAGPGVASAQIPDNSQAESALFHFGLFDLTPSISVNNWFNVFSLSSFPPKEAFFPRARPIASIS